MLKGKAEFVWENPKEWVSIGKGSFSEVFRLREMGKNNTLVCKVVSRRNLAEKEAYFLSLARHPLFPEYYGMTFWQEAKRAHMSGIFMEDIAGCSLHEMMERRRYLSTKCALKIAYTLAEGLSFLHELPGTVIYRDLKPENVMVQQDGRIRLVDLGCACFRDDQMSMGGTKGYAAPEQLQDFGKIGMESDIYALGKLLYYMLSEEQIRKKKGLQRLLEEMTASEQQCRIPDMRILMRRLEPYVESGNPCSGITKKIGAFLKSCPRRKEIHFYYENNIKH